MTSAKGVNQRDDQCKGGDDLEVLTLDIHRHNHESHTEEQQDGMVEHRIPVVARLVGQRAGGTIYLKHTDDAQQEEHHPDDAIALDFQSAQFIEHI